MIIAARTLALLFDIGDLIGSFGRADCLANYLTSCKAVRLSSLGYKMLMKGPSFLFPTLRRGLLSLGRILYTYAKNLA